MTLDELAREVDPESLARHRWVVCLRCLVVRPVWGKMPFRCDDLDGELHRSATTCECPSLVQVDEDLSSAIDTALSLGGYEPARDVVAAWSGA